MLYMAGSRFPRALPTAGEPLGPSRSCHSGADHRFMCQLSVSVSPFSGLFWPLFLSLRVIL